MTEADHVLPPVLPDHVDYLRDESRMTGTADSISFPRTEDELADHVRRAAGLGRAITVQGGRTGIAGGAVPRGGHVLNLSRLNRVLGLDRTAAGDCLATVQSGVALADLRKAVADAAFDTAGWSGASLAALEGLRASGRAFFPPDPTETSATLGGMAACNASGAQTFFYGPTRRYVEAIRVVLADGDRLDLRRGRERADGRRFGLRTAGGRILEGRLPGYDMPRVKNAAGYFAADGMDLLDLFIGSEGTLGILSQVTVRLVPAPPVVWGLMVFLPKDADAVRFVGRLRAEGVPTVALEFFSTQALALLRDVKRRNPSFDRIPDLKPGWGAGLYVEFHAPAEAEAEAGAMAVSELLESCGGTADDGWLASDSREMARLKDLRHAVPEAVNLTIDERRKREPKLTKLGTDLSVPDDRLEAVMAMYADGLRQAGLEHVIFGHIGNNHVHVNILPNTLAEYDRGKALYLGWARQAIAWGGSVAAEHGIGKLKVPLLREMFGEDGIRQMRELKRLFDPAGVLNPGNLFAAG